MSIEKKGIKGEVWIMKHEGKNRPFVIVTNDYSAVELDHSIAKITSQAARDQFDIVLEDWEVAGLAKPSVVRCSKINTVLFTKLSYKIGKLSERDLNRVLETIVNYFSPAQENQLEEQQEEKQDEQQHEEE